MRTLAARAMRLGSRDPESAAQEAVQRSLANCCGTAGPRVLLQRSTSLDPVVPAWNLSAAARLAARRPALRVWEERARASTRRETPALAEDLFDVADPAPSQLDQVIAAQLSDMVQELFVDAG
jgi:hypothetical protein